MSKKWKQLVAEIQSVQDDLSKSSRASPERKQLVQRHKEITEAMRLIRLESLERSEQRISQDSAIADQVGEVMRLATHIAGRLATRTDRRKFWTRLTDASAKERILSFKKIG